MPVYPYKLLTMNIQYMEQYTAALFYMHVRYIVCLIISFLLKALLYLALNVFFYKYNKGTLC
jgi:hypothetical protein